MRDVDDAHHAEDERQPQRCERKHERGHRTFEQGQEEMGPEAHARNPVLSPRMRVERDVQGWCVRWTHLTRSWVRGERFIGWAGVSD